MKIAYSLCALMIPGLSLQAQQQPSNNTSISEMPEILIQEVKEERRSLAGPWVALPSKPQKLMPYLQGLFVPSNNCLRPSWMIENDALSQSAQQIKEQADSIGLRYDLTMAFNYASAPSASLGQKDFIAFNGSFSGSWFLLKTADESSGLFMSFELDWGPGLNFNERSEGIQESIGSLSNPQSSNRGGKDVFLPELTMGMSAFEGKFVMLAGTIDSSNYMDQNAYSDSWAGDLINESFNYNSALPLQWANLGILTAYQPCKSFYMLHLTSSVGTDLNHNPFNNLNHDYWSHVSEMGYILDDAFGLGKGTYRLLSSVSKNEGHTGFGIAYNVEQKLGKNSPLGVFSRAAWMDEDGASITGVKKTLSAGLVLDAPFRASGWGSKANNEQIALGMLWERAAHSQQPYQHRDEYGLELSSTIQITPTMYIQPDIQYIFKPVHGSSSELILQLQTVFSF